MKTKFRLIIATAVLIIAATTTYALTRPESCATCTGNKPCKACKNCNYCKHCAKDGGTCGVCKK